MHSNMKAFEFTKEIVVAKMASSNVPPNELGGEDVAKFFEAIFNKLVVLEDEARKSKND